MRGGVNVKTVWSAVAISGVIGAFPAIMLVSTRIGTPNLLGGILNCTLVIEARRQNTSRMGRFMPVHGFLLNGLEWIKQAAPPTIQHHEPMVRAPHF